MPIRVVVNLSPEQEIELEQVRSQHRKAYMRERAAAVLKVAGGQTLTEVAEQGLVKRHEPETVHLWINLYQAEGLKGWEIKKGRGRKPAFSPKKP